MAAHSGALPTIDAYQLRLPNFEGPLDVLLRLIEREQLPIGEISLLSVLDQFLAFMRSLDSSPPEMVAEFAAVAGRLSLLKSRSLLPRPAVSADEHDEPDLVRQLEEYRAIKSAAALLEARQRAGAGVYGRGEAVAQPDAVPPRLVPQPRSALIKAVNRWLTRIPVKPTLLPRVHVLTLTEMIGRIASALDRDRQVSFEQLRHGCAERQDVAVAFLAMLTLLRRHVIIATQDELFGPITMHRTEPHADIAPLPISAAAARPDDIASFRP
jgi:segregation and condensation protein A